MQGSARVFTQQYMYIADWVTRKCPLMSPQQDRLQSLKNPYSKEEKKAADITNSSLSGTLRWGISLLNAFLQVSYMLDFPHLVLRGLENEEAMGGRVKISVRASSSIASEVKKES